MVTLVMMMKMVTGVYGDGDTGADDEDGDRSL